MRDNWKESTQITQGSYVKRHIRPYFENMLLSEIKPSNILAFHLSREEKGLGLATRNNLHAILGAMFTYALDNGLIEGNPVKKRKRRKSNGGKAVKPALNEQQMQQLLAVLPIRYKAF